MCGIAGYTLRPHSPAAGGRTLQRLLEPLRVRGPDDEGVCLIQRSERRVTLCRTERTVPGVVSRLMDYRDAAREAHDAALVHARFAIIDLSPGGHQPFVSHDGSVVGVYHGEIYNYLELRSQLQGLGVVFRTASDAEVLVEGYRVWRDRIWERLNGFWAVALFDRADGSLVLCRDRFGVAPLYYRETSQGLYFASMIRPLLAVEPGGDVVEPTMVEGFIDTELKDFDANTCYRAIHSLPPATALRLSLGDTQVRDARPIVFWNYPEQALAAGELPFREAVNRFRDLFMDAVALRLRADVPIAFELSGGLDSSSIVAAAALQRAGITTYTLKVPQSNEEPYARTLLRRYPLDYRVIELAETDFFADAAAFLALMEEPFHSPNVYTHYKLRQVIAQEGVDVVLSGSGGDELLAGYEYEFWPQARAELLRQGHRLHAVACDVGFYRLTSARLLDAFQQTFKSWKRKALRNGRIGSRLATAPNNRAEYLSRSYAGLRFHDQRLFHFRVGLLPYYLRSDDHFSMALPIEQRSPFLDYRVVDLGLRIPAAHLFRRGWTKYILRKAMEPFLPREIVWRRKKMGFPFPLRAFLQRHRSHFGPLLPRVAGAGLSSATIDYDTLLRQNPQRLWRICSTGLWLDLNERLRSSPA